MAAASPHTGLRLVFMGTPDFAVPALTALRAAGHEIVCVYSQPPRPAGRGRAQRPGPVAAAATAGGLPLRTPTHLKDAAVQQDFAALDADAAVIVAYGLILPPTVLAAPPLGCLNIHASLLPRWRGAAPIQRAILAGDDETGITIMRMDEGLDTGPVLLQSRIPITAETTAATLHDPLAALGATLIVEALDGLARGTLAPRPQPDEGACYAKKLTRAEGRLDFARPAAELERRVRALTPWPGAWFEVDGERVKVLAATVVAETGAPGTVLNDAATIACGTGALRLTRLQRAGKAALDAPAFLRGFPLARGRVLTAAGAAAS